MRLPWGAVYERAQADRALMSLKCIGHPPTQKLIPDRETHQVDVSLSCKPQR